MLERRPHASQPLVEGYCEVAQKAEVRRTEANGDADTYEEKAWTKVARDSWAMAEYGLVDVPEGKGNYLPLSENLVDRRVLSEIMQEGDGSDPWGPYKAMALAAGLRLLSPTQRTVAEAYYGAQVKRSALADMLKMSENTLRNHIANIEKKWSAVREEVEKY